MRPSVLRTESPAGAVLVLAGALILLGGIQRPAHAAPGMPGIETCSLTATPATSFSIASPPPQVTYIVDSFTCTDTAPSSMFGIPCGGAAVPSTLGGTFDVNFIPSPTNPNTINLTIDIHNITMVPFTLCDELSPGFSIDVTEHVLNSQDLGYSKTGGALVGRTGPVASTTSDVFATVNTAFTARATKQGTYTGSFAPATGNLSFDYAGTWQITSSVPGLTPLGRVILVVLLAAGAGLVLWRRRVAGA